jgi:predicted MFS family arabinose efflux permease
MAAPDAAEVRSYTRDRMQFAVATFFYWASLYLYVPVLPVYVDSIVASLGVVGIVISSYALPQLLFRVPIGLYYDAVARHKPAVALSIAMCVFGAVGLAYATGAGTLFLSRALTGVGAAGWVAFTTFYTGYYPTGRSSRAIGSINAVNQVALVVATGTGGILADAVGYRGMFLVAAGLAGLGLLAVSFAREPAVVRGERPHGGFRAVASNRLLLASAVMAIMLQFATFSTIFGFIPSYGASIGATNSQLGSITMVTLGASAVAALASVRLAERFGYSAALALGAALLGGALFLVPATTTVAALALVQLAAGLGRGSLATLLMALSIRSAPSAVRATAMGIYQAVYASGMLAGPLVSGYVAESLDLGTVFRLSAAVTLVIALLSWQRSVRAVRP